MFGVLGACTCLYTQFRLNCLPNGPPDRRVRPFIQVPQAPLVQASDSSSLAVKATNEYGEFDRVALALYGLEMIVEPYRETTLSVEGGASSTSTLFHWRIVESDDSGIPLVNADPVFDVVGGREVVVMLTIPGGVYLLTVEELPRDGTTVAQGTVKINCKYVRREIRDLSEVDRVGFLDALKVYYTVPTDVGKALYGEMFMNYKYITAVHNSQVSESPVVTDVQRLDAAVALEPCSSSVL